MRIQRNRAFASRQIALAALLAWCGCIAPGCIAWRGLGESAEYTDSGDVWRERDDYWFPESASSKEFRRQTATVFGQGPNEEVARTAFERGRELFDGKQYREAAAQFRKAANRWPDSMLEDDALFWLGESRFFADRYAGAVAAYDNLLEKHPNSQHLDVVSRRRFEIADYWLQRHEEHGRWPVMPNVANREEPLFDVRGRALKLYENIMESDSTGPLADDAVMRIANAHFAAGRFDDAADYYDMLRRQFVKSDHLFDAYRLGAQCELRRYQGPDYDGQPLVRAEELLTRVATMFPDKIAETPGEQERLVKTQQLLQLESARRDVAAAEFYDRTQHYEAARIYYDQIAAKHAGTPLAVEARERLAQLQGEPNHPPTMPQRLARLNPFVGGGGKRIDADDGTVLR